jgi:hypothetical protein
MAFKLSTTSVFPGIYNAPTATAGGTRLYSNGSTTYWNYPGETNTLINNASFQYRSIITHGFLLGGYKNSNPWRSVNKTWHATDTTYYVGEQMDRAGGYFDGFWSDYNAYGLGTFLNESFTCCSNSGGAVHTSSINLHTGSARTRGYGTFGSASAPNFGYIGDNPTAQGVTYGSGYAAEGTATPGVGGWDMSVPRHTHGAITDQVSQKGYAIGGGYAAVDKMDFATEVMYTTTSAPFSSGSATGGMGQTYGWAVNSGTGYKLTLSNDSWVTWAQPGSDGYRKFLCTKLGYFYIGTGSNVTLGWAQVNDSTGASITTFNGISNVGEENLEMGQSWGYMLGNYNGNQNNMTWKFTYSNNAVTALGTNSQPKGHNGQSSGFCASAAASVTATRYGA